MNYHLGADEQNTSVLPFGNFINPTRFDYAAEHIAQILEARKLGSLTRWFTWQKPDKVNDWLKAYIIEARIKKIPLSRANFYEYVSAFESRYRYSTENATLYCDAFITAQAAGYIDDIIYNPTGYIPSPVALDFTGFVQSTTKSAVWTFLPWVVGGVAAYALMTGFLPSAMASVTKSVSSRK